MPEANKIQQGYILSQDGAQFEIDSGTAAAPGLNFDSSTATGMYSPGTGQIAWSTSGKQTALRILADGKIGIDCNPTVALEVNGTIKASAIDAPIEGTLDDWIVHAGDANTKFGFPAADTYTVETAGSERVRVSSAGNVGIGTNNPSAKLQVSAGHINIDAGYSFQWGDTHERIEQSDNKIEFFTGNGEKMTLSGDRLGIGQTSPASRLHISEAGSNTIQMQFTNATTGHSGGTDGMTFGYSSGNSTGFINVCETASFLIKTGGTAAGNERFRIGSNGNANFGAEKAVAYPSGTGIQVYHSANPRIKLINDTTGNAAGDGTQLYLSTDGTTIFDNKDGKDIRFDTGGTESFRIDSDGRLLQNGMTAIGDYMHQMEGAGGTGKVPAILFKNGTASTNEIIGGWTAYNTTNQVASIHAKEESANDDAYLQFSTGATGGSLTERLRITSGGQSIFTANKSSGYTAKFNQTHADNPAWIEINSPNDNNLRPAYILLQNNGTNKWGIGQVYQSTSSGAFHIAAGAHSQANSKFTITTGGRVGIGTVNPGTRDTTGSLDIQANLANNGPYFRVLNTHSTYGGGFQQANNNARGGLAFLNASGSSVGNFYHSTGGWTWDQNLQVTGSGGLRIGTTTGNNLLEVRGDATSVKTHIGSSNGQLGNMPNSSEYGVSLVGNNAEFQIHKDGSGNYQLVLGTYQGSIDMPLVFRTDNRQERMRITKAGQVVIGDTDADNAHQNADELIIGNNNSGKRSGMTIVTASNQDGMIHFSDGTGSGQYQGQLNYHHNDNTFRIYTLGQERLAVDGNGNTYLASDSNTYIGHPTTDTLEIKTEGKDAVYITNSQVLSTAKHENKVLAWSGLNDRYWNNNAIKQFVITYYTGASSATYHVCRMISQTDWGFDNIEFKIGKYQYNPASDDLFSRRFSTYYSSHSNQLINYNQQGSGSGTGAWGVMDWRQDFGPGGSHTIHQAANGGYYRDCYGSDVYVSLGTYTGIRVFVTVWATAGLYDTGDYANAYAFYPANFQGQATQTNANNWGGPRGTWFNTSSNGTGTGSNPGVFKFSTGSSYGQVSST